MKFNIKVDLNLKTDEAKEKVEKAAREAMRDTVVAVAGDARKGSPVLTGNNRRSITEETSGFGSGQIVDQRKIEGAVFSTSGYGGFLETGTSRMGARPYIKPAADREVPKFPQKMKRYIDRY